MLQLLLSWFLAEMGRSGEDHQAMAGCELSTVKRRASFVLPWPFIWESSGHISQRRPCPLGQAAPNTIGSHIKLPQQFPRHETIKEICFSVPMLV